MACGIKLQTVVKDTATGRLGVVCPDLMGCCADNETPVVFNGETSFEGTPTQQLEIIGPENAIADPKKCGAGSEECCIFLTCGATGFNCERHSTLRYTLMFKEMKAKRHPAEPFPLCQTGDISTRESEVGK